MNQTNFPQNRRQFLVRISLLAASLPAILVSIPLLGALLAPLIRKKKQQWRKVASLSDIPAGSTKLVTFVNADPLPWAGLTAKTAAWIRRENDDTIIAFSANCTHLGCPVRWESEAHLFMCPCHGGVYYEDGAVASGPPPKPLTQYLVRIRGNEIQLLTAPVPITEI